MLARRAGRIVAAVLTYWFLFLLLDTGATLFEVAPGVSPWYPSAGLNFAFLVLMGPQLFPAVFVASMASGLLISSPPIALSHLILPNLVIAGVNALGASWVRRTFSIRDALTVRAALTFAGLAFLMPAFIGGLSVLSYAWTGLYTATGQELLNVAFGWWVGDVVGILTATPLVLFVVLSMTSLDEVPTLEQTLFRFGITDLRGLLEFVLEMGLLIGALYLSFYSDLGSTFQFHFCFPPLLWIALRHGLPRTAVASAFVNVGAAIALRHRGAVDQVPEFQLFMIALALTGLFLGVVISERQRAVSALRRASSHLHERLSAFPLPTNHRQTSSLFPYPTFDTDDVSDAEVNTTDATNATRVLADSERVLRKSTENLIALNEYLLRSERRMTELNEQKDRFLSIISHDLKNPLVGIRGLAEMLMRKGTGDGASRPLQLIQRSSQQALDLLENLLTWARLETGHITFDPQPLNVHSIVEDTLELLQAQAEKKDIALENDVPPSTLTEVDQMVADTVLRNLVSNAIKFTEAGGFVAVSATASDDALTLAVADSGVGISDARMETLFYFEERTSTGGTAGESGTGLGLHLCRELLDRHDQRIWVESEVGVGTTFYFTLPLAPELSPSDSSTPSKATLY